MCSLHKEAISERLASFSRRRL
uniref:Uncharacterized protein n=1 Tax=Anguilla anguilla TaxID=7936 RepID=A0A0E9SGL2_ANGAN